MYHAPMTARMVSALLASTLVLSIPASLLASDPHMTAAERDQLIKDLKDSQAEFVKAVSGLSDAQWKWKPAPERWSVGECAEHIMLAEGLLFDRMQVAIKSPAVLDWEEQTKGKTEILLRVM